MSAAESAAAQEAMELHDGKPELLVLRALKLGDLLVAVPALKALRRTFPEHRLRYAAQGWLSEALGLVGGYELFPTHGLDEPLAMEPGVVDVAVNLHGSGPESQGRIEALQARQTIGHRSQYRDGPPWRNELHERERWAKLLEWHGIEADPLDIQLNTPHVPSPVPGATVLHVGAAYGSRLWPAERFAAVASALDQAGHNVVFTGGSGERDRALDVCRRSGLAEDAVLAGRLGLAEFAATIAAARLVISADTGAAHLASAYGTPSVVLFGPAPPEIWGPPPGPHVVLTRAELRRGDTFAVEPDPALLAVTVQDVLAAVRELGVLQGRVAARWPADFRALAGGPEVLRLVMGAELEITLVLTMAFLWIAGSLAMLSGIDRPERKARRQERRADRAGRRRVKYRPVARESRLTGRSRQARTHRLRPH